MRASTKQNRHLCLCTSGDLVIFTLPYTPYTRKIAPKKRFFLLNPKSSWVYGRRCITLILIPSNSRGLEQKQYGEYQYRVYQRGHGAIRPPAETQPNSHSTNDRIGKCRKQKDTNQITNP